MEGKLIDKKSRGEKRIQKSRPQRKEVLSSDTQFRMYLAEARPRGVKHSEEENEGRLLAKKKLVLSPIKLLQKTKKKKREAGETLEFYNPNPTEISRAYYYSSSHISPMAARIIRQSKLHHESMQFVQSFHELPARPHLLSTTCSAIDDPTRTTNALFPALHH